MSPVNSTVPAVPRLQCGIVQPTLSWMEDGVSDDFLRHYCETDDLLSVNRLDIQVDSAVQSVESLGDHLPNLRHLRLTDSSVLCVRDIGTSLLQLEVLWMSRCGLQDLNGVGALPCLREFYLPFNDVSDLTPLSSHDNIEVLDVEGNAVESLEELAALGICSELRELTLTGNPVCRSADYSRQAVLDMLPQLSVLDDMGTDPSADSGLHGGVSLEPNIDSDLDAYIANFRTSGAADNAIPNTSGDSADGGCDSDADGASSVDLDADMCRRSSGTASGVLPVQPLESSHPLLARGLEANSTAGGSGDPYAGEPDEQDLVLELVKRSRPKPQAHAFTARARLEATWGFNTQLPDRRQVRTAEADPAQFRPATTANSGFQFDDIRGSQETASDLTCGGSLAGNPLLAVRQRRSNLDTDVPRESGMDIRELLRRYQTYTQPSCIPPDELMSRKREAEKGRPGTPDVRITTAGRPGSSSGASMSRRNTAGGGRRTSGSTDAIPARLNSGEDIGLPRPTRTSDHGEVLVIEEPMELA